MIPARELEKRLLGYHIYIRKAAGGQTNPDTGRQ